MPITEVPLRGIQRLVHPIQAHRERVSRRQPQNQRTPDNVLPLPVRQPEPTVSWENDPRLTEASKQELREDTRQYRAFLERKTEEYFAMRAREPKAQGSLAQWREFRANQQREEQVRQPGEIPHFAPLVAPILPVDPKIQYTPEARRERDLPIMKELYDNLMRDTLSIEPEKWVQLINKNQWGNKHTSKISYFTRPNIKIQDDGMVIDSSQFGVELTQVHKDRNNKPFTVGLIMGMGYFHNKRNFPPETRDSVSDADLKRGVKGYFVMQRYPTGETGYLYAVPFAYADNKQKFHEVLYRKAEKLKPDSLLENRQWDFDEGIQRWERAA